MVEVLVVIGIIAVLTVLITPAFQNVLSGSKLAKCSSNLRQWGLAFQQYMNDHDGYLPQQAEIAGNADTHWQELIAPYLVGDKKNWNQRNVMRAQFPCPGETIPGGIVYGGSYYIRTQLLQADGSYKQNSTAPKKLANLNKNLSDFVLLAENYTGEFWDTAPKSNPTLGGIDYTRHRIGGKNVSNFLFADFHIEPLSYQQTLTRPAITLP